jgi:hypothetical protein
MEPPEEPTADRREEPRRADDVASRETALELGRLAMLAGARVEALEGVGQDVKTLTASVERLGDVIGNLATKEEVEVSERRQDHKRRGVIVVGTVVAIVLGGVVGTFLGVIDTVRENSVVNRANGQTLVECTTPGNAKAEVVSDRVHECYDKTQAQTSEAVASIALQTLDAAVCARFETTPEGIESCFADRIFQRTGTQPDLTP